MSFENRRPTMEGGAATGGSGPDVQSPPAVTLCKTGCGFYANSAFEGMCSKCFRDEMLRKQATEPRPTAIREEVKPAATVKSTSTTAETCTESTATDTAASSDVSCASSVATTETETSSSPSLETGTPTIITTKSNEGEKTSVSDKSEEDKLVKPKPKKNRCLTCRKNVGLTGFGCRCGGLYCAAHRYSDKHDCSFDYKELGQEQIRKCNPVVVGEKIKKL